MQLGQNFFKDVANLLPGLKLEVIFDVGANIGETATAYCKSVPFATVYCFEPIASTFRILRDNTDSYSRIICEQLALGSAMQTAEMVTDGPHQMHHMKAHPTIPVDETSARHETVTVTTIDSYCTQEDISRIHLLKSDTEGFDMQVLIGAREMLERQAIDLIDVEVGMHPRNLRHVPFEEIKAFLQQRSYFVFGLYQQVSEWTEKKPQLRRVNAVFISETVITAYTNRGKV